MVLLLWEALSNGASAENVGELLCLHFMHVIAQCKCTRYPSPCVVNSTGPALKAGIMKDDLICQVGFCYPDAAIVQFGSQVDGRAIVDIQDFQTVMLSLVPGRMNYCMMRLLSGHP